MGVQEVRWDKGGTVRAEIILFFKTKITNWEKDFFVHHKIGSAVTRVEFVSDRM